MEHKFVKHKNCMEDLCMICDGGLLVCTVCGGAESSLTTDCCGKKLSADILDNVSKGKLDYIGGKWDIRNEY